MPPSPMVVLAALIGLVGLTAPLVAIAAVSIRSDAHSPAALQDNE